MNIYLRVPAGYRIPNSIRIANDSRRVSIRVAAAIFVCGLILGSDIMHFNGHLLVDWTFPVPFRLRLFVSVSIWCWHTWRSSMGDPGEKSNWNSAAPAAKTSSAQLAAPWRSPHSAWIKSATLKWSQWKAVNRWLKWYLLTWQDRLCTAPLMRA